MTSGDPFAQTSDNPFVSPDTGPPTSYGVPTSEPFQPQFDGFDSSYRQNYSLPERPPQPPLNTYAVLAPIFGVLVPPAGVVLGHLALPQIKRIGQRGWLAAVCGLVIGYLLSILLVVLLIWLLAVGDRGSKDTNANARSAQAAPPPSVVTSVAPAPMRPHTKLDLNQATVGKCVEIEKRDDSGSESGGVSTDEALDLYEVPCQHRVGVYTVVARVTTGAECNSTYVAAPPDRSFAICLNRY